MLSFKIFLRNRKYLVSAIFYLCLSMIFSTWITYIPYVCEKLLLSEGQFGTALFFSAVGSFITIPIANRLVLRVGVGRIVLYALIYFCVASLTLVLAPSYILLCVALLLFGSGSCLLNISMNSLTAAIEKSDAVMIMSGSHGFFSAGGLIGASLGVMLSPLFTNPVFYFGLVVSVLIGSQVYFRSFYYHIKGEPIVRKSLKISAFKPLLVVAIVGLIMMVAEGAIADWSALYLKNVVHINKALYGFGFLAFAFSMMVGRFLGDWISSRYGSWYIIGGGSFFSLIGFSLILTAHAWLSILGFSIVGLGFSVIVPEVFRIASRTEHLEASEGISFLAGVANVGFLIGPVLLGFLAEFRTLRFSYLVLTCFVSILVFIALFQIVNQSGFFRKSSLLGKQTI